MMLSAQRVRSARGVVGVNLYEYRHVAPGWSIDLDVLEHDAELMRQEFEIPPGGNDVRSYLDVFAPEGTNALEIARAVAAARSGTDPSAFPALFHEGDVTLRLGLVFGLVPTWRSELTDLAARLLLSAAHR